MTKIILANFLNEDIHINEEFSKALAVNQPGSLPKSPAFTESSVLDIVEVVKLRSAVLINRLAHDIHCPPHTSHR